MYPLSASESNQVVNVVNDRRDERGDPLKINRHTVLVNYMFLLLSTTHEL